jgi:hypothetical protein
MPTPLSRGNTDFREVSVREVANRSGMDGLTVILKGRQSALQAERNKWPKGAKYPGYPYMVLETKESEDRGAVCELVLNFVGLLNTTLPNNGKIDTTDSISRQSVTLNTNADENVSFSYYAQQTTTRWMFYGVRGPTAPRFRAVVPSSIPISQLFNPDPPNYTGSIVNRYKVNGRLAQFDRQEVSSGVWMVVESWDIQVEPVSTS